MIGLCALALLLQSAGPASDDGLAFESRGGYFQARLAKVAGQERVADAIARWRLSVSDPDGRVLWSCFHPAPDPGQRFLLAQDGSAVAVIEEAYGDTRAVVQLRSAGDRLDRVAGGHLRIAPADLRAAEPPGTWLAPGEDSARFSWILGPFGPLQMLDLQCTDGILRRIDLASGLPEGAGGGLVPVRVEPWFEKESVPPSALPVVSGCSAPAEVWGDQPLVVTIEGQHPNPGWSIFAFGLEPGGPDGRTLVLGPRARPPMPGGLQIQKSEPFRVEARVRGLPPGEHTLQVQGAEGWMSVPLSVRVLPGGVFARLRVRGGILGLDETATLFENGVVAVESNRKERNRVVFGAPRAFAEARAALMALPALPPAPAGVGSDLLSYELAWRVADAWRELAGDDGSLRGQPRRAIDALLAVAHGS